MQGTRSYMAPEQIRGKALDAGTDIYSFGCMLYELVSGKLPFTGVSPEDLLRKHLYAPIPVLSGANKNVTPDFSDLVGHDDGQRRRTAPDSMEDLIRHFRVVRVFRSTPKPPPG